MRIPFDKSLLETLITPGPDSGERSSWSSVVVKNGIPRERVNGFGDAAILPLDDDSLHTLLASTSLRTHYPRFGRHPKSAANEGNDI